MLCHISRPRDKELNCDIYKYIYSIKLPISDSFLEILMKVRHKLRSFPKKQQRYHV